MASDMRKPMGITVLRKQEVPSKLWPLPITDMWGIGKKSVPLLEERGIHTIGDLADPSNETMLMTLLGKQGYMAIQHAVSYTHLWQEVKEYVRKFYWQLCNVMA